VVAETSTALLTVPVGRTGPDGTPARKNEDRAE
jgi:hypothetical protein